MTRHHQVEERLRDLDAAPDHSTSSQERTRALLERVIAIGAAEDADRATTAAAVVPTQPASSRRRTRTRAVLVTGGLVAAATAGLLVVPPLLSGGDPAYASWTAVPQDLTAQERPDVAEDCRDALQDTPGPEEFPQFDEAAVAIAERRGAWVTVVLAGPDGFSATCTTDASDPFGGGWVGSAGIPTGWEPLGPRQLLASGLGVAYASGPLSMAEGYAGADVTGVTYRSAEHGTVVATVAGGHFAFWFPGGELDDDMVLTTGVPVDVNYSDGSTARVVLRFD